MRECSTVPLGFGKRDLRGKNIRRKELEPGEQLGKVKSPREGKKKVP